MVSAPANTERLIASFDFAWHTITLPLLRVTSLINFNSSNVKDGWSSPCNPPFEDLTNGVCSSYLVMLASARPRIAAKILFDLTPAPNQKRENSGLFD